MKDIVSKIGHKTLNFLKDISNIIHLFINTLMSILYLQTKGLRVNMDILLNQIRFTGVAALPIVSVLALLLGVVTIIQSAIYLPKIGASTYIGNIITMVIIREVGPLVTTLIVIGRSGTAIATELGSMKSGREIEALEIMGINPYQFIVIPRLIGVSISVLCLIVYFDAIAIIGGYGISCLKMNIAFANFITGLQDAITLTDLILSGTKGLLFGFIIAIFGCYQGLSIKGSPTEIPQAATKIVVRSILVIFMLDSLFAFIFYFS